MKSLKYIFGTGIILSVIDVAFLYILNLLQVINYSEFSDYLSRTLSTVAVVVLASVLISFILKIFKSE